MSEQSGNTTVGEDESARVDPSFFVCVNEYLEVTNRQSKQHGLKRISMASMFAAARFNAHVYLAHTDNAAASRTDFLDYMTMLYRRILNEHLDSLGQERGIDVGESELAQENAAAIAAGPVSPAAPVSE